jgi:hypothetical protein
MGLPLDPAKLLTERGGQVLGLSKAAVQAVLERHGIDRVLAEEGGRTSRGSIDNMREYVAFLNNVELEGRIDLDAVEKFWIGRVHEFFAGKPFKIKLDSARGLRAAVREVIDQAQHRERSMPGMHYAGAVLQHLVGAKLDCALGRGNIGHNSFSTADAPTSRVGDFLVGDVAIHVTTSPGESVIRKCLQNLNEGNRPLLLTLQRGLIVGEELAAKIDIGQRIDIFEIEQFLAVNLYELGKFEAEGRRVAIHDLVERYNEIVEEFETDPSLRIEFR